MSLNEDLQTWTAAQRAAWRIQRTWERFWTAEATREAPMCHCTRRLLRHLEHGKEMMLPAEPLGGSCCAAKPGRGPRLWKAG
ncbi:saoe class I histocompatibility antigen, C alpha chain-like [Pongo pygmaeus]|uniref:saoe class I histocompatibility antigen, C alpha chain-like n=1 Tax=Pongo pygmaeus TaxID=9600 RepID=UPI00300C6DB6